RAEHVPRPRHRREDEADQAAPAGHRGDLPAGGADLRDRAVDRLRALARAAGELDVGGPRRRGDPAVRRVLHDDPQAPHQPEHRLGRDRGLHAGADRLVGRDRHRLLDRRAAVPGDLLLDAAALLAARGEVLQGLRRCGRADAAGGRLAHERGAPDDHAHRPDGGGEPRDHPAGADRLGVRRGRRRLRALVRLPRGALRGAGAPRPDRQGAGPDGGVPRLDHLPDRPVRRPRDRSLRHPVTPGGAPDPAPEQALRPADERILEQYLSHLRIERGLSANTLAAYRRDLRRYLAELARRDIDATAVDPQQLGRWLQSLRTGADGGSVLSASSAARSLAAVRGLHSFLDAERVSSSGDPARLVPSPALPRRLPHPLAIAQVEALLEAARRPSTGRDATARALRDRALLEVLYGLGARISETTGLDVDDIDAQERAAVLRGKGDKHRVVPVGRFALEALEAYLTRGRPVLAARG